MLIPSSRCSIHLRINKNVCWCLQLDSLVSTATPQHVVRLKTSNACLHSQQVNTVSPDLADKSGNLPKDSPLLTTDACQATVNATYYPWCLESGYRVRAGSLCIEHGTVEWLSTKRFPIRSSLSHTIGADERSSHIPNPPTCGPITTRLLISTSSREQTH